MHLQTEIIFSTKTVVDTLYNYVTFHIKWMSYISGLAQDSGKTSMLEMELPLSYTEPLICSPSHGVNYYCARFAIHHKNIFKLYDDTFKSCLELDMIALKLHFNDR